MSQSTVTSPSEASWTGQDIDIHDVVNAVDVLRRREQQAANRTSVATMTIVSRTDDHRATASTVIEHLGVRHPARIINLLAPIGAGTKESRIDAEVHLHVGQAEGHRIWSDEIRLDVSGGPARHLASLLRPLQLSDLPVVVWYVSGLPDPGDPLLKSADAVIFDSKTFVEDPEDVAGMHRAFSDVATLSRKHTLLDLSWARLLPWRRLLAGMFQGAAFQPFVEAVERVEIGGKLGPRVLLAGWMGSRLHLDHDAFDLVDRRHVGIVVHSRLNGVPGRFTVRRTEEQRLVVASAEVEGGPSYEEVITLPEDTLPRSLASALRKLERDRVWEQAVKFSGAWL